MISEHVRVHIIDSRSFVFGHKAFYLRVVREEVGPFQSTNHLIQFLGLSPRYILCIQIEC